MLQNLPSVADVCETISNSFVDQRGTRITSLFDACLPSVRKMRDTCAHLSQLLDPAEDPLAWHDLTANHESDVFPWIVVSC